MLRDADHLGAYKSFILMIVAGDKNLLCVGNKYQ